jgi:acyl-coenzyme A synthetase/AMP-(fatty) acid ligase
MTELAGADRVAPGALQAWRRHLGEEVVAFVVPARDGDVDHEVLATHARERLSAYKCPMRFFTIEQLPRNEIGKVLRDELVHMAGETSRESKGG